MKFETNKIYHGNTLDVLKTFPNESISMCITSPPYWALRDYGTDGVVWDGNVDCEHEFDLEESKNPADRGGKGEKDNGKYGDWEGTTNKHRKGFCNKCGAWKGQLGLEPDFNLYIKHLCDIFDEVKRVLRKDGTCWVNLGDTYNNSANGGKLASDKFGLCSGKGRNPKLDNSNFVYRNLQDLPNKSLCNIPSRFSIEMQNRGWILRNKIIWHKPNCMPSSVTDRFTVDFEEIFFFVKNKKYYFEQQFEGTQCQDTKGRNKRTVWKIPTQPFPDAHFAVFPEKLVETPIKAGCPLAICTKCSKPVIRLQGSLRIESCQELGLAPSHLKQCDCNAPFVPGIVLDPFMGSGTTALVALKQNKQFVGIDINQEYINMAYNRIKPYLAQTKLFNLKGEIK